MANQTELYSWVKETHESNGGLYPDTKIAAATFYEIAEIVGKASQVEMLDTGLAFAALAERGSPRNDLTLLFSLLSSFLLWDECWQEHPKRKPKVDFFW